MILADSSVWIDYFRDADTPQTARLDWLIGREHLGIGDLMLTEILQGIDSEREFRRIKIELAELELIEICGETVAVQAARNYRHLRGLGITIRKTIDTLIATRCIQDNLALLFSDRDFEPFVIHLGLRSAMGDC